MSTTKERRPAQLINAIVVLYIQAALNAFAGVLLFYFAAEDVEHGQEVPGVVYGLATLSIIIAVVLLAGAILLTRRVGWIRIPVTVIEVLSIISGLITLASSAGTAPSGIVNLVLSAVVLASIWRRDTEKWLYPELY